MNVKFIFAGLGIFAAGVGAGVGGTLLYQKYAWDYDEEIVEDEEISKEEDEDSESECDGHRYSDKAVDILKHKFRKESEEEKTDYREYIAKTRKYKPESDIDIKEDDTEPMLITKEEYESLPGYESEQLYLYLGGVVADIDDCPIEHPGALLGYDFIEYFDNGDEVVYIRNPRNRMEYELELVNKVFSEGGDYEGNE